jgi:hypothetical protein
MSSPEEKNADTVLCCAQSFVLRVAVDLSCILSYTSCLDCSGLLALAYAYAHELTRRMVNERV